MKLRFAFWLLLLVFYARSHSSAAQSATDLCRSLMRDHPDIVCLPLEVARATDVRLVQLEHDLAIARLKSRRVSFGCSIGPGAGVVLTYDLQVRGVFAPLSATCGLNISLAAAYKY